MMINPAALDLHTQNFQYDPLSIFYMTCFSSFFKTEGHISQKERHPRAAEL